MIPFNSINVKKDLLTLERLSSDSCLSQSIYEPFLWNVSAPTVRQNRVGSFSPCGSQPRAGKKEARAGQFGGKLHTAWA
jgi:hypothetical protein